MPNPFPGMNPWLEAVDVWSGLHGSLIVNAVKALQPLLRARGYFADGNERVWIEDADRRIQPDVAVIDRGGRPSAMVASGQTATADQPIRVRPFESEMREPFLEIFDARSRKLITSLEFLSPTNKSTTKGRRLFEAKQQELLQAGVNRVEIDLLRAGRHLACVPQNLAEAVKPWDYLVCVSRPSEPDFELYPVPLRRRLPRISIPLKAGEADVVLDLQAVLDESYDAGPYPDRLDYQTAPEPPLSQADAAWADTLLRQAELRTN